ncbi:MAG: glutamate-5-semialdehyde dehydrogenase [Smithellaceae bacterium]|nr:glutamate-5-semialdehyde dehydrogenase [Smithellaceae bacterium]
MDTRSQMIKIARQAKDAARGIARATRGDKDRVLLTMGEELISQATYLIEVNALDVARAKERGLAPSMIDRLTLDRKAIDTMAAGLKDIVALPDPVGNVSSMWQRPNGLLVGKMRIPLGVIGIIYEARPNVTIDAAGLCLKSGNAVILRGGSEAIQSNLALGVIVKKALAACGLPENAVQVIPDTDRAAIYELLQLEEYIDLIIPRGGEELIRAVVSQSKIPVIKHYKGVCHIFVDAEADQEMAVNICLNAKTQRPGVCNAMETLLVHQKAAPSFLPLMAERMTRAGVILKGCPKTREILPALEEASEEDWHREYLDLILSVRVVDNIEEAIAHIEKYGSMHTEAILTNNYQNSQRFLKEVNSSTVLINASTRFNDGFELGLGAEIGISTTKLHAFGPMGLEELTTSKFIIYGNGQVRT